MSNAGDKFKHPRLSSLGYEVSSGVNPVVKYVDWGLANAVIWGNNSRLIRLNKNLLKYPKLHDKILLHEKKHFYDMGLKHIITDLKDLFCLDFQFKVFVFMIKHPKSFYELLPIQLWLGENKIEVNLCLTSILFVFLFLLLVLI